MSKINQILVKKLGEEKAEKVIKKLDVARVIKNVVCWILIAVLAFAVITFLLARVNGSTPSVFGFSFQRVETASMVPALEVGDVVETTSGFYGVLIDVTDEDVIARCLKNIRNWNQNGND